MALTALHMGYPGESQRWGIGLRPLLVHSEGLESTLPQLQPHNHIFSSPLPPLFGHSLSFFHFSSSSPIIPSCYVFSHKFSFFLVVSLRHYLPSSQPKGQPLAASQGSSGAPGGPCQPKTCCSRRQGDTCWCFLVLLGIPQSGSEPMARVLR